MAPITASLARRIYSVFLLINLASATCYWAGSFRDPNNASMIATDDQPCFPAQQNSPCCGSNWTCLSNGMCEIDQGNGPLYYRGTCTDRTWDSTQCPGWCFAFNSNTSIPMYKCPKQGGEEWYCCPGDDECDCDTGHNAVKFAAAATTVTVIGATTWSGMTSTTSAFSQTALPNVSVAPTSDANPSATSGTGTGARITNVNNVGNNVPSSGSSSGSKTAIAAGVGVAAGVVLLAVIGAATFFLIRRRRRNSQRAGVTGNGSGAAYTNIPGTASPTASDHGHHGTTTSSSSYYDTRALGPGFYATKAVNEKAGNHVYEKSTDDSSAAAAAATAAPAYTSSAVMAQELDAPLATAGDARPARQQRQQQEPVELA